MCDDYLAAAERDVGMDRMPSRFLFDYLDYLHFEPTLDPRILLCDGAAPATSCGGEIAVLATPTPYVRVVPPPSP